MIEPHSIHHSKRVCFEIQSDGSLEIARGSEVIQVIIETIGLLLKDVSKAYRFFALFIVEFLPQGIPYAQKLVHLWVEFHFKTLIEDLANVTQLQVDRARGLLRVLLGREIVLHPCADGAERYLTAEVTGDYAGLLRLVIGQNKSGGGQGS
jgi:hypothetical protein